MARLNDVMMAGKVISEELEPKLVSKNETGGESAQVVLNFKMRTYDKIAQRYITLPVAVWGEELVEQCITELEKGDSICVKGELRFKFIRNKQTGKTERIYINVKASCIEFLSKKMKTKDVPFYKNSVQLIGNLVSDVKQGDEGFVVAVDRLYPTRETTAPNSELTDFITVVANEGSVLNGALTQGSNVIIEGRLMTRKKRMDDLLEPRIVVAVDNYIGIHKKAAGN